ncbi:fimbrial protein [Klebsiella sp. CN_Kp100]|uniref:fimbrial protein n=1 Tax=Klebsiella sp. CN_Kp100 TaxID=3153422 RepID=UPI0032B4C627
MNKMMQWACMLVLLAISSGVNAACDAVGSFTLNPGSVTVQRDVAVGQPFTDWIYSNSGVAYQNCNYDSQLQYNIENGIKSYNGRSSGLSYNGEAVFDTNLPGVGFVVEGNAQVGSQAWIGWQGIKAGTSEKSVVKTSHNNGDRPAFTDQMRIRLIKTGNIQTGALSGNAGYFYAGVRETANWSTEQPVSFAGGQITSVACSVTTNPVDVSLGDHNKNEFSGVGTTTSWKTFTIGLDCDQNARINVRIDPAAGAVGSMTDVMKLDNAGSSSTASGVGVQLWFQPNGGSAVKFGQETFYWTSPQGGMETVQLQARYYQTEQTITPGTANATATFTLTYK